MADVLVVVAAVLFVISLAPPARQVGLTPLRVLTVTAALVVVVTGVTVFEAMSVRDRLLMVRASLEEVPALVTAGDLDDAQAVVSAARSELAGVSDRFSGWSLGGWGRHVPVVASHVAALTDTADALDDALAAVANLVGVDPLVLVSDGRFDVDELPGLVQVSEDAASVLADVAVQLTRISDRGLLLPVVSDQIQDLAGNVGERAGQARDLADGLMVTDRIVAVDGEFLVVGVTSSEPRAGMGMPGSFARVRLDDGRLTLVEAGRVSDLNPLPPLPPVPVPAGVDLSSASRFEPDRTLQNVTMQPHVPDAALMVASALEASGGQFPSLVVVTSPEAAVRLVELTGPVQVSSWPSPLGQSELLRVLMLDQYLAFRADEQAERTDFLAEVFTVILDEALSSPDPLKVMSVLGDAVWAGDLAVVPTDPALLSVTDRLGLSGSFPSADDVPVGVSVSDLTGSKMGAFTHVTVDLDAVSSPQVGVSVSVTVENRLNDPSGYPAYVVGGGPDRPYPAGTVAVLLQLRSIFELDSVTLGGERWLLSSLMERDLRVFERPVIVPPGGSVTVEALLVPSGVRQLTGSSSGRLPVTVVPPRTSAGVTLIVDGTERPPVRSRVELTVP